MHHPASGPGGDFLARSWVFCTRPAPLAAGVCRVALLGRGCVTVGVAVTTTTICHGDTHRRKILHPSVCCRCPPLLARAGSEAEILRFQWVSAVCSGEWG